MSDIESERELKQKYLRENIDAEFYEEFMDFCVAYAGEIDIDAWNLDYVKELVDKFNESLQRENDEQEKNVQKSFAIYQSLPGGAIESVQNILQEINDEKSSPQFKSKHEQIVQEEHQQIYSFAKRPIPAQNQVKTPQVQKSQKNTPKIPSKNNSPADDIKTAHKNANNSSAVDLLDSVFQEVDKKEKVEQSDNQKRIGQSFFDSVNFWEVPQVSQSPKKNVPNQNTNSLTNVKESPKKITLKLPQEKQIAKSKQKKVIKSDDFEAFYKTGFPSETTYSQVISQNNFNTFSEFTNQEVSKRNRSPVTKIHSPQARVVSPPAKKQGEKLKSQIKIKQIKEYNPTTMGSQTLASQSNFSEKDTKNSQAKKTRKKSHKFLSKVKYDGPKVFKVDFQDTVSCVKSVVRPNHGLEIYVKVVSHEIIQRSIFASDYIMYTLRVQPHGKTIKRNYEDFSKLRNAISKIYPVIQLPFLEKEGWIATTSTEYAQKQGQMLQLFIADILSHVELKNSRILEDFLTITDHKKIKRKFEEYQKMGKIDSIEELCLLSGCVDVALTQDQRINKQQLGKLHQRIENGLQKYKKLCEMLSSCFNQVISTQKTICDVLHEIQDSVNDFNKRVNIKQIHCLDESLKQMRDSHHENAERTKFEKKIIDADVLPFIRYQKQNVHIAKQILDECNTMTNKYMKRTINQQAGTGTSYLSKNLKQFKNGILNQSKNMLVLKYQTGYLQSQASNQLKRIFQHLGKKIRDKWVCIGQKYSIQFNSSMNLWNELIQ